MTFKVFRLWKLFCEDLLQPIYKSTSYGGGKFYIRATGVLMAVKEAHSFCIEIKGTARVIQNLHKGPLSLP